MTLSFQLLAGLAEGLHKLFTMAVELIQGANIGRFITWLVRYRSGGVFSQGNLGSDTVTLMASKGMECGMLSPSETK